MRFRHALGTLVLGLDVVACGATGNDPASDDGIEESTELVVDSSSNGAGSAETFSPTKLNTSSSQPFFHSFGTNGRACSTCHVESLGWSVTPSFVSSLSRKDPLFSFDGSDCLPPGASNSNPTKNSTQLRNYGTIRVELPIPEGADFTLVSSTDPLGCPTPATAAALRLYRRPLPSANTAFLATVMWDGRENVAGTVTDDLKHQANDATLGHAQATTPLSDANQTAVVAFETGTFFAQRRLGSAVTGVDLTSLGAHGGARYLHDTVLPEFFIGINDPFQPGFDNRVFDIFAAWERNSPALSTADAVFAPTRASIGRGEVVFNTKPIQITNVSGLNGPNDASQTPIAGFCGTCHDTPNVGDHSVSLALDIGITAPRPVGGLDVAHLPTYTFQQTSTQQRITVTDGGRGLVSGKFVDLGKTKGPILRGLSARAPYFHNGSAKDLNAVVSFYDTRFGMGLTAQEKRDLATFLSAL
ncbi:MAG TPA: hypothetical protein VHU80_20935 [Polyangiaceae bacterium]|nr:hypothetical protein [Polyangiaceae bacterium]